MALIQRSDIYSDDPRPGLALFDKTGILKRLPSVTFSYNNTLGQDGEVALWADGSQVRRWVIATGAVEAVSVVNGT